MKKAISVFRVIIVLLIFIAIISQIQSNMQLGLSLVNFFHFFTIESNIFIAVVLLYLALLELSDTPNTVPQMNSIKGATTLYITITGVVYSLLLTNVDVQTSDAWVNYVLHYIVPVYAIFDWIITYKAVHDLRFKETILWLIYPILYLAYSLVRGYLTGWYPYPFLNPENSEYGYYAVLIVSLVIVAFSLGVNFFLIYTPRLIKRQD